jgi:apolipoprotein N-acyltransferase
VAYIPYGLPLDEVGVYTARFVGAAYLGLAAIVWLVRDAAASEARRAVIVGFLVVNTVTFLVSLSGILFGPANALSWTTVLVTLLLALGFGYFLLRESLASGRRQRRR